MKKERLDKGFFRKSLFPNGCSETGFGVRCESVASLYSSKKSSSTFSPLPDGEGAFSAFEGVLFFAESGAGEAELVSDSEEVTSSTMATIGFFSSSAMGVSFMDEG